MEAVHSLLVGVSGGRDGGHPFSRGWCYWWKRWRSSICSLLVLLVEEMEVIHFLFIGGRDGGHPFSLLVLLMEEMEVIHLLFVSFTDKVTEVVYLLFVFVINARDRGRPFVLCQCYGEDRGHPFAIRQCN